MKKILYSFTVLLIITGAILLIKKRANEIKAIAPQQPPPVEITAAEVVRKNFPVRRHFIGVIEPEESADILSRVQASVSRVLKHEGDQVNKGELLIELDSLQGTRESLKKKLSYLNIQQKNSELIIKHLRESVNRDMMLFESGGISKEQLQSSENKLLQASSSLQTIKAQIEEIKTTLRFFNIKAPYNGVISSVMVQEGDIVLPGTPLLTIELKNKYRVVVKIDTGTLKKITKGKPAEIIYQKKRIKKAISRVHPSLSQGVGIAEILMNSRPFGLPSGTIVDVYLETQRLHNVLVVPEDTILELNGEAIIYRIVGSTIKAHRVNILAKSNKMVAISGDIQEGNSVVRASEAQLLRLYSGIKVKIKK